MIQCILIFGTIVSAASLNYEPGKVYEYSYDTDLIVNSQQPGSKTNRDVGFKISSTITLNPVWKAEDETLVKLQFSNVRLQSVSREDLLQKFNLISKEPLYFTWRSGSIGQLFTPDTETTTPLNIKKGLISLLQLQMESGERPEVDASGDCTAHYTVDGPTVTKKKTACSNLDISGQFSNVNHLLEVSNQRVSETLYEFANDIVETASCVEGHQVSLNAKSSVGAVMQVRQYLRFIKVTEGGETYSGSSAQDIIDSLKDGKNYLVMLPVTDMDSAQSDGTSQLKDLVDKEMNDLAPEVVSSPVSAKAFLKLLPSFRLASKQHILELLNGDDYYNIIPQLIDLAVAAQTRAAQEALMEVIQFDDSYQTDLAERYLLAVAYTSHPDEALVQDLFNLYKKKLEIESLQASVSLALGAVLHTFKAQQDKQTDLFTEESKLVPDIQNAFVETLDSCTETPCKVVALRSLANARLPGTLPVLIKYAETSDVYSVSTAALKAIKNLGVEYFTTEVRQMLYRMYHQNKQTYDSTVRTSALEIILMTRPSVSDMTQLILSVTDKDQFEMSKYVLETIRNAMKWDESLRATVQQALSDIRISNYDVLAPNGKSSAVSGFIAEMSDGNCTFSLLMENSNVGIMKKSIMDVQLIGHKQTMPFVSFGLFARGLEAVAGDSGDEGEQEEVTAGLALDLMDVSLRPVTFFEGQGGLMSAVWSAPSSPISVLQGNLLLHDHVERIHLQNGMVAELDVQGGVSFDLSGSISISLWSRNSHSVVTNSGAIALNGQLRINTPHFDAGVVFDVEATSKIDFTTDVDFYEMPFKMCLQMEQPPFQFSEFVSKFESAKGFKKTYKSEQKRTQKLDGRSFSLNVRNAEQCKVLIPEE